MNQSFPGRHGLIHIAWMGYGFTGGRIGELRAFPHPVAPIHPQTSQPAMPWEWGCHLHERPGVLHISMVQSFTRREADGTRTPMPPFYKMRLMRDLLAVARALGFPRIHYDDMHTTEPCERTMRTPKVMINGQ